jgi:putative Holliday junction resolvase
VNEPDEERARVTGEGRVIAFDLGARRIGYAISDPTRLLAERGGHLLRSGASYPWKDILRVIEQEEATHVVVGDPLDMSGESGSASQGAHEFARELSRRTGIPCDLEDERLTSVEASRILIQNRGSGPKKPTRKEREQRRAEVDRIAASLILQSWLDRQVPRSRPAGEGSGA